VLFESFKDYLQGYLHVGRVRGPTVGLSYGLKNFLSDMSQASFSRDFDNSINNDMLVISELRFHETNYPVVAVSDENYDGRRIVLELG